MNPESQNDYFRTEIRIQSILFKSEQTVFHFRR
uniref:Uncharacterized protein n=1 Tax=Anguilla anguilla TaxID=7936 RepID=A0A0E9XGL1_ANGAN